MSKYEALAAKKDQLYPKFQRSSDKGWDALLDMRLHRALVQAAATTYFGSRLLATSVSLRLRGAPPPAIPRQRPSEDDPFTRNQSRIDSATANLQLPTVWPLRGEGSRLIFARIEQGRLRRQAEVAVHLPETAGPGAPVGPEDDIAG